MPIGSAKIGVLGAGLVPGGTQTFNASGTFTVPPGVKKVNITGKGGTGNPGTAGNPGNPGNPGNGGVGGQGGAGWRPGVNQFEPGYEAGYAWFKCRCNNYCLTSNPQTPSYLVLSNPMRSMPGCGGVSGGPAAGVAGNSGNAGTAGSAGSAGNPGNASSGLTKTFPGGVGGNAGVAGAAGNGGSGGPAGSGGNDGSQFCCQPAGNGGAGGTGGGSGGNGIRWNAQGCAGPGLFGRGAGGGGGAGAVNSGSSGVAATLKSPTFFPGACRAIGGGDPSLCSPANPRGDQITFPSTVYGGAGGGIGPGMPSINASQTAFDSFAIPPAPNTALFRRSPSCFNPSCATKIKANVLRSGSGGGSSRTILNPNGNIGGGGGGGGRGTAGNSGGASPTPSGSAATPQTFNCVPVTPGSPYPITVGGPSGGQVVISWNPQ